LIFPSRESSETFLDAGIKLGQLRIQFIGTLVVEQLDNLALRMFDLQIEFIGLFADD
jgi:hypothetical protein